MNGLVGARARELPEVFGVVDGEGVQAAERAAELERKRWNSLTDEQRSAETAAYEVWAAKEEKLAATRVRLALLRTTPESVAKPVKPVFEGLASQFYNEDEILIWAQRGVDIEDVVRPFVVLGLPPEMMRKVTDTSAEQVAAKALEAIKAVRRSAAPLPPMLPNAASLISEKFAPRVSAIFEKAERTAAVPLYTGRTRG